MTPEDLEQIRAVVREETNAALDEHDSLGKIREITADRDRSQTNALSARVAKLEAQVTDLQAKVRRIEMQNP
jgi:polyhydroxyalkanoate synthesis regulator phasin